MTSRSPRGLMDGLWEACLTLLIAAVALRLAVAILVAIWPVLAILLGCVIAVWGLVLLVRWWRWRR